MVKISQREYALKSIDEMRDSKGETFCDINQYLTSPHPALSDYLMNGVHAPLQDKFKEDLPCAKFETLSMPAYDATGTSSTASDSSTDTKVNSEKKDRQEKEKKMSFFDRIFKK